MLIVLMRTWLSPFFPTPVHIVVAGVGLTTTDIQRNGIESHSRFTSRPN
jgi:hypothetical protein